MSKNEHIKIFIDDLLNIKADLTLLAIPAKEKPISMKIAADGPESLTLSASKIGSLTDADNKMLVRVYKDDTEKCFLLYFLAAGPISPAYGLLSISDESHIFLIDTDGQVNIPYSTDIDPLNSVFHLSFPKQIAALDDFPETDSPLVVDKFRIVHDHSMDQLDIELMTSNQQQDIPTKLVFRSGKPEKPVIRLIPIRDLHAIVHVDPAWDFSAGLTLCTYA